MTTSAGVITLAGDTGDHSFTADVVTVSSVQKLELTGTGGTQFTFGSTTNATLDIPLSTIGTINGLDITMQGGNDTISFDATNLGTISGHVTVNLGDGTNSLTFKNATVAGNVAVTGGSGNDTIQMSGDAVQALSISTGDGNDTVTLTTDTINGNPTSEHVHEHEGEWGDGWWGDWGRHDWFGWGDHDGEANENNDGPSLNITTGNGNDTVTLNTVTGKGGSTSSGEWHSGDHEWWGGGDWWGEGDSGCRGRHSEGSGSAQWQITLGSGTDSVTLNSVNDPQSLSIRGGSGTDTVSLINSTIQGRTDIALTSAVNNQIDVTTSTLGGKTTLSSGSGDSQTIGVNDSTFQSSAKFSMSGSSATLKIENGGVAGPGTTFQESVVAKLTGPSAVADLGGPSPNNTLTFEEFVSVFGGNPAATVNVATANTTLDNDKLFLFDANRNNV